MARTSVLSRGDVEHLIAEGAVIVIYENAVLRLDKWVLRHPGGDKAVFHLVGQDATEVMDAYHSDETRATFLRFQIGVVEGKWENFRPPIQGGVFRTRDKQADCATEFPFSHSNDPITEEMVREAEVEKSETLECEKRRNGVVKQGNDSCVLPESLLSGNFPSPASAIVSGSSSVSSSASVSVSASVSASPASSLSASPASSPSISPSPVIRDPQLIVESYDAELTRQDVYKYPSVDYATQESIIAEYRVLNHKLKNLGLYKCDYWGYFRELCRICSLLLLSAIGYKTNHMFLSAVCMGLAWQQMTFIVHDAGHVAITHNYQVDNVIGILIADFCGGLSVGWWKRNHNVHHIITNDPVNDPDIQHLPFFAVSTRLFGNVYSTYYEKTLWYDALAKRLIPLQNYTYYLLLSFGRFNLYRLSWEHLLKGLGPRHGKAAWFRYLELVGLTFFFYWFFYLLIGSLDTWGAKIQYIMVSHVATMIVHVQITLSHFAMSTADLGVSESFPQRQLRTTMDVDCPAWLDYVHGGLQFQAVHHLFPRMPRHNFRAAQRYVIEFCDKVGLEYCIYGFTKGNATVIGKLREIANQAVILAECANTMKEEELLDPSK